MRPDNHDRSASRVMYPQDGRGSPRRKEESSERRGRPRSKEYEDHQGSRIEDDIVEVIEEGHPTFIKRSRAPSDRGTADFIGLKVIDRDQQSTRRTSRALSDRGYENTEDNESTDEDQPRARKSEAPNYHDLKDTKLTPATGQYSRSNRLSSDGSRSSNRVRPRTPNHLTDAKSVTSKRLELATSGSKVMKTSERLNEI
jgi:hypothetical protein